MTGPHRPPVPWGMRGNFVCFAPLKAPVVSAAAYRFPGADGRKASTRVAALAHAARYGVIAHGVLK